MGPRRTRGVARANSKSDEDDGSVEEGGESPQPWKGPRPEYEEEARPEEPPERLYDEGEGDVEMDDEEVEDDDDELMESDEDEDVLPQHPQQRWGDVQPGVRTNRAVRPKRDPRLVYSTEQIMATAVSEADLESAKGLTCERGGEAGPAVVMGVTEERRREAALALQASVDESVVCEPGRLCFRAIICIPDPTDPHTVPRYRGRKNTTDWVTDSRGYDWRLMYFPLGNNTTRAVSLYLEVKPENAEFGQYCRRNVNFHLRAINYLDDSRSVVMSEDHEFTAKCVDWGFPRFLQYDQLFRDVDGLIYDGKIVIEASLQDLSGVVEMGLYDAKRETGMVGLRNQGATCYMNSLLQTLWGLRQLRMAVYDMPTETENAVTSVALALQRVFFRLQTSDKAVFTKELTKAFGWDVYESFLQQDVQELMRVLCDKLEEKMKGTRVDGTIKNLFEGRFRSFTRCINVDYVSQREESFYDVQLDVKGCGYLSNSFQKYIGVETLTGDNQYDAEGHGKQDAERGMIFMTFPPVLTVHLKRFEFDPRSVTMVKINDRFEFPLRINLDAYVADDCRPAPPEPGQEGSAAPGPNVFSLHSILVHSGDVHAGHYYAYIRPSADPESTEWFKFDDELVTRVSQEEALEDSFGAQPPDAMPPHVDGGTQTLENGLRRNVLAAHHAAAMGRVKSSLSKSTSSAYMLVYVREADLPQVMRPVTDDDIPTHLRERFIKEMADHESRQQAQRERAQFAQVEVLTEEDVRAFRKYTQSNDFAAVGHDTKVSSFYPSTTAADNDKEQNTQALTLGTFKLRRDDPLASILPELSRRANVPMRQMRLWSMCTRQNKTVRVDHYVSVNHGDGLDGSSGDGHFPYANHNPAHLMTQQRRDRIYFRMTVQQLCDEISPRLYLEVLPPPDPTASGTGQDGEEEEEEDEGQLTPRLAFGPRDNLFAKEFGGEGNEEEEEEGKSMRVVGEEEEEEEEDEEEKKEDDEGMEVEDEEMGPHPLFPSMRQKRQQPHDGPALERKRKLPRSVVEEEERVMSEGGKVQDVLNFLQAFPPPAPKKDHIMVFFKRYDPGHDPADPLQYKFYRHVCRSMNVTELMALIRESDDTLPPDAPLELFEVVTPNKVTPLPPTQTLEVAELMTGDIICYQLASSHVDCDLQFFNRAAVPQHVDSYFHYIMHRRRIHFRPYGTRDKARLQASVESIQQRGLEVKDRCWLVLNKDVAEELVLEMATTWTYRRFQEVLASFLQPAVDHPFKLRLHGCELTDVRPARLNRALYKAAELDMKEYSPQQTVLSTMPQLSLKEGKEDVLFFEVLPFPMPDMDTYLVKDVVINDATLRRAAAPSAAKLTTHRTPKRPKPAAGQPGDPAPAGPLRVRPAPVEWTMWSTGGDPLVATVLLAREASVGNLVEAMDDLLGLDTRRKGPPHVRIVLADAHYRIQQVMRWDQDVEQLPDSHLKALMPSPFPGRLMDARGKVMYEVVEERERDLLIRLRNAKLVHADLLRRRAAAATNGGGGVDEEKHRESGGENGGGGRLRGDGDEEEPEEEEAEDAEDDSIKFLPLQVNFASVGQDKQSQANGSPRGPVAVGQYSGFPLVSFLEHSDTLTSLLQRLAPRIGEDVQVLMQWEPRLYVGSDCYDWPADEPQPEEEEEEEDAMPVDQAAGDPAPRPSSSSRLWAVLEKRCSRYVNVSAFDLPAWTEVPSLTFIKSEPVAVEPAWKDVDSKTTTKRTRGNNAGIKIR